LHSSGDQQRDRWTVVRLVGNRRWSNIGGEIRLSVCQKVENDLSEESPTQLDEFRRSRTRPTIFCVKCGSLEIEQNAVHVLQCLNCRNTLFWNGYRFSIARENYAEHDAISAFTTAKEFGAEQWRRDWHFNIIRALWQFSDVVNENVYMTSTTDPTLGKSGEEFEELVRAWNKCKEEIDVALSRPLGQTA
jgi:hypothetical protein